MEEIRDSGAEKDRKRGRGWSCLKDNCICKNKPKETGYIFEAAVWNSKVEIRENFLKMKCCQKQKTWQQKNGNK